jgi:hypothetical protein
MRPLKIGIAFVASAIGLALPWRARVVYSELLGRVANLVPPRFYRVRPDAGLDAR